jgi:protein-S-isoprenylcysteine O-methyltransferase Ste14
VEVFVSLQSQLEKSGQWLFRHRSYLPIATVPLVIASLGSFGYLGRRHWVNELWQVLCLVVSLCGLAVRVITVGHAPFGTSGRNTREHVAQTLTTTGTYSIVRHPLYVANFLIMIGFVLLLHVWWLVLLTICIYVLYYERIILSEEAFLSARFGRLFEQWAAATPAIIPRLRGWKTPQAPFCWRTVLTREYNAMFLITTVFFLTDMLCDSFAEKRFVVDYTWFFVFLGGFLVFSTLRTLKKRTRLLHVEGR